MSAGGVPLRHVSARAVLAQKWAAHHDRGRADPLASHDLEDILALLASRPTILEEVAAAPAALRGHAAEQAKNFLADVNAVDLLHAHLNKPQHPAPTVCALRTIPPA